MDFFFVLCSSSSRLIVLNGAFVIIPVTQWLWTWRCAALLCILALILVTAVVVCSLYLPRRADAPVFPKIPDSSVEGNYPIWKNFPLWDGGRDVRETDLWTRRWITALLRASRFRNYNVPIFRLSTTCFCIQLQSIFVYEKNTRERVRLDCEPPWGRQNDSCIQIYACLLIFLLSFN